MRKSRVLSSNLHFSREIEKFLKCPSRCTEKVKEFENKVAVSQGAKWGISVNSCTSGLMAALLAIGIEWGDEVIIPPLTWPQTYFPASFLGAKLKTVDLSRFWPVMNPNLVKESVHSKTKVVISVGLWGFPAGIREINDICKNKGVVHILDAAQLFNAKLSQGEIGDLADLVVLSFGSTKGNYGLGEGGIILGNSMIIRDRILFITQHPYRIHSEVNDIRLLNDNYGFNFNFRLNPMAAFFGINKIFNNESRSNQNKERVNLIIRTLLKYKINVLTPPERWSRTQSNNTSVLVNTKGLSKILIQNFTKDLEKNGFWARRCPYRVVKDLPHLNGVKPFPWYKNMHDNSEKTQLKQNLRWANYWNENLMIISDYK